ncbi:MAG: ATP synthase F1 subunit epsilon [Clostridia bacterium]|nr:ATP synthase F1 subunit epsilon [Clostridia bacterium]MDY4741859.1 ATP synthase F1 subunit epsilon [Lachnospira sp.]
MADSKTIKLLVNTPDRVFYHDDATFVELSTSEGDIGVYPDHIPLTAVVVPSVLTIHQGNEIKKAAIHGGIVEILKDKITILAEVAEWSDEIDVERANEARLRAEKRLASKDADLDMVRAEAALKRSLARINAAN